MVFGISTWFFQEKPVTEALGRIASAGFRAAEVWMEHLSRTGEAPEKIRRRAEELGLTLSLHAYSYDLNFTSVNEGIARESRRLIEESIVNAGRMGAAIVAVHPGRLSSSRGSVEKFWKKMEEVLPAIDGWAAGAGVRVGLEPMENRPREQVVQPEQVRRLFHRPWSRLGLTLDIAHAFTVMDPVEFIRRIDPHLLAHVHLSDGAPGATHLPLGQGEIDIQAALNELDGLYDGLAIVEGVVPGGSEETVRANAGYLRALGRL